MPRELRVIISGDSAGLERALGRSSAAAQGFAAKMESAGKSMQSVGKSMTKDITLPIVAIGAVSVKMAMDFGDSMTKIQTQAGASAKEVKNMSAAVLKMAATSGDVNGPKALSEALYRIESAGIRGAKAVSVLRAADDLATVGHANLEAATYGLVGAVKSGIKGAQNFTQAIGTMNAIVGQGNMRMDDLTAAFATGILPMAKAAHVSLAEVGAALDVFTNRGKPAVQSATGLTRAMAQMMAPTKSAIKSLADLGIGSTQLAQDLRSGGLLKAVDDIKAHFDAQHGSIQATADVLNSFGKSKGGAQMLTLVQNSAALTAGVQTLKDKATGVSAALVATQQDAATKMKAAWASLQVSLIQLGDNLMPIFEKLVGWVARASTAFQNASPEMKKWIEILAGVAAAAGPVVFVLGSLARVMGGMASVARGLGSGLGFLAANPLFIVPFAAIAGGLYLIGGAMAEDMMKARAADSALRSFQATIDALKSSLNDYKQAHLDVAVAQQRLTETHRELSAAGQAWSQVQQAGKQHTQEGVQALDAYRNAQNANTQAVIDYSRAQNAGTVADQKRAASLTAPMQALDKTVAKMLGASDTSLTFSHALEHPIDALSKLKTAVADQNGRLDVYALKLINAGEKATTLGLNLEKVDPAASKASEKVGALAVAVGKFIVVHGRLPTKTELVKIDNAPALAQILELARKAKAGGEQAHTGFLAGVGKVVQDAGSKMAAAVAAVSHSIGAARGAARSVGVSIGASLAAGISSEIGAVQSAASAIAAAAEVAIRARAQVHSVSPLFKGIGSDMMTSVGVGIENAMGSVATGMANAVTAIIRAAVVAARAALAKAKTDLASAVSTLTSSLSSLSSAGASAFDTAHGGTAKTRDEAAKVGGDVAALAAQQAKEQQAAMDKAILDARTKLSADIAGGADPATLAADQAAIDQAVQANADYQKGVQIAQEQADLAEKQKRDKDNFEKALAGLENQAQSANTEAKVKAVQAKIAALFKKYGITPGSVEAGADWNAAQSLFVAGMGDLKKSMDGVVTALDKLRDAVRDLAGAKAALASPGGGGMPHAAVGGVFNPVPGGLIRVVEDGHPEAIIPLDPARRGRAHELMGQVHNIVGFADGGLAQPVSGRLSGHPMFSGEGPQYYSKAFSVYGPFSKGPYKTQLSGAQEKAFRAWAAYANGVFGESLIKPDLWPNDYDDRGLWRARGGTATSPKVKRGEHGPDTFKTPYDTAFSRQSKYATGDNPFDWAPNGNVLYDMRNRIMGAGKNFANGGIVGFGFGGVALPRNPDSKTNPSTGLPDDPAYRSAAMYLNDYGADRNDTAVGTALAGLVGPRAQAQAAIRPTHVDGMELRQGSWRAAPLDSKMVEGLAAMFPGIVFEGGTPGSQISAAQALSRITGGIGSVGGWIQESMGLTGAASKIERMTSHAVHFGSGYLTDARAAANADPHNQRNNPTFADIKAGWSGAKGGLIPALAGGGRLLSDGLFYGHKNERVVPASVARGGGPTQIVVMLPDGRVLGQVAMDAMGEVERFGGPIRLRR